MKEILLTQGKIALVDDDMFEELNQYKWQAHRRNGGTIYYAVRKSPMINGSKRQFIYMHREVVSAKKGEIVDHINRDGLHNYRENIRKCTHSNNMQNRRKQSNGFTGYTGVTHIPEYNVYSAHRRLNNKEYYNGCSHKTAEEAGRASDELAKRLHGEYAVLNFPEAVNT